MNDLQKKIRFEFKDPKLLTQALTHRSLSSERGTQNERLEFLGDSILGFVAAKRLYKKFPRSPEGVLTQLRALYVCQANLAQAAKRLQIEKYLHVSKAMRLSGMSDQPSVLSDTVEAIIGAAYLDQGLQKAEELIDVILGELPDRLNAPLKSPKTELQELIQAKYALAPVYEIVKVTGPAHTPRFCVRVLINNKEVALGEGSNKKLASEEVARQALRNILGDSNL